MYPCLLKTMELKLKSRHHIRAKEFKDINWLPTKERAEQRAATNFFKYWKGTSPFYVNELFLPSRNINTDTYHSLIGNISRETLTEKTA